MFEDKKYFKDDNPNLRKAQAVMEDVRYAIRHNGPAFWRTPTPEAVSKLRLTDTAYIVRFFHLSTELPH